MAQQVFSLFAAKGRVYARNVDQKLVDLGELAQRGESWCWLLDGNKQAGSPQPNIEAALRDVARHLRFLWLDGQFTALADARDDPQLDLTGAPRLDFTLDELSPGERAVDATV